MGIFKKKEPRVIKDDDPLYIKLWYGKRSHAAIVLGLYFIFFLILIVVFGSMDTSSKNPTNIKGSSIKNIFDSLSNEDGINTYNYLIKDGSKIYYFSGKDEEDSIYGTMIFNSTDSSHVRVLNDECTVGEYVNGEFKPAYSLCPENINYKYFSYDNIYNLIENVKGIKYDSEKYYLFQINDDFTIKVYYKQDNILDRIVLIEKNSLYEFNYSKEVIEDVQE